jgi:hypothetical protein
MKFPVFCILSLVLFVLGSWKVRKMMMFIKAEIWWR